MAYQRNPLPLLLIPLAVILGGGAVATAVVLKKKKALPAAPPQPPGYPYAPQPGLVPSGVDQSKHDPMKAVQQAQDAYKKYGASTGTVAKKAWDLFTSGGESKTQQVVKAQEAAKAPEAAKAAASLKLDLSEEKVSSPAEMPENTEKLPAAAPGGKAGLKEASSAAGSAATGAKVLGVGLGTVALVGVGIVVCVAAFESFRSMQKQNKKLHDDYKLWRAMAVQYAQQREKLDKEIIPSITKEINFMKQAIPKMQAALAQ